MPRARRGRGEGTIYQRKDGRWEGAIYLGVDADGRRIKRSVYGPTRKAVQERLRELQNQAQLGTIATPPPKMSLAEYLNVWLESYVMPVRRAKTSDSYSEIVRLYINPIIGHVALAKLQPTHLQSLYAQLIKRGLSARTVQYSHAVLRSALRQAVGLSYLPRNPTDVVKSPTPPRTEQRTLTRKQAAHFLAVVENNRLYALFLLAITTGMRRSELLGLRWSDVSLDHGYLSIRQTIQRVKRTDRREPTKNKASRRPVALTPTVIAALRDHRTRQDQEKLALCLHYCDNGLAFATKMGAPLNGSWLTHHFQDLLVKAGLPRVRFHDLRHTMATLLLESGTHPKIVQERLGHSNIGVTMDQYSHVLPHMQHEAAHQLDNMLFQDNLGQKANDGPADASQQH